MGGTESDIARPRLRVLVVDDNADGAESLAILLRMHGHDPRVASDGPQALREAEEGRPDVVLLDLGLPGLNGYEVARRIREQPWGHGMTLIAITGYADDTYRRRSAEAGIDLHLAKPVDFPELQALLLGSQGRNGPPG
jgi:CheY-like chemotaxis protein